MIISYLPITNILLSKKRIINAHLQHNTTETGGNTAKKSISLFLSKHTDTL